MRRHASTAEAPVTEGVEVGGQFFADPFDIPAALSPKLQPEKYQQVFRIIEAGYPRLLRKATEGPRPRALLVCGRKVVAEAANPEEFDSHQVRQIEAEHDAVCFVVA